LRREKYNKKADIWSYGIIVWELIAYQRPFADKSQESIFAGAQHNTTPIIPEDCPHFFNNLMSKCWKIPPASRPSFVKIVNKLLQYQPPTLSTETVIPLQVIHNASDEGINKKKKKKEAIIKRYSNPVVSRHPYDLFLTSTSEEQILKQQLQEQALQDTVSYHDPIMPAGF